MVAESVGRMVTIVERDGKSVQTIECDKFKHPRGVATGPDGAIYVTDVTTQCLFKFNTEGKLLKTVQSNLKKPHSVKIIRNQLYIADNSNQVQIFDTDCNAVGSIQTKECPRPYDTAEGEGGLYVVGVGGKMAIYRCAPNGEFIRHLNTNPSLALSRSPHLGSSTRPLSVCLSVCQSVSLSVCLYIYIYISYVRHFWSRGPRATRKRKPAHLKFKGHMHACCIYVANASRAITTLTERLHMCSSSLITSNAG